MQTIWLNLAKYFAKLADNPNFICFNQNYPNKLNQLRHYTLTVYKKSLIILGNTWIISCVYKKYMI